MTEPLYLVRLLLNRRALLRVGVRHRLGQQVDDGALLHAGLAQLFAKSTERATMPLHTFTVDDLKAAGAGQPETLFLLAYTSLSREELIKAMGPARPDLLLRCDVREMPTFVAGQRLGFRARVCPVTRTRSAGDRVLAVGPTGRPRHREIDAFVHATLSGPVGVAVEREALYLRWLDQQLQRLGGTTRVAGRLTTFHREMMRRRNHARIERPNAVLEGTLVVNDPSAFQRLLIRGIGRHRAFGFGMLLLRPAGRMC